MRKSLSDQFLSAGLISPKKHQEFSEQRESLDKVQAEQQIGKLSRKSGQLINLTKLESCSSVSEFKNMAREILQKHPEDIGEIINLAHNLQGQLGGRRLVWLVYQAKEGLQRIVSEKQGQFLKRVFRKSGSTTEIPKEWLK